MRIPYSREGQFHVGLSDMATRGRQRHLTLGLRPESRCCAMVLVLTYYLKISLASTSSCFALVSRVCTVLFTALIKAN